MNQSAYRGQVLSPFQPRVRPRPHPIEQMQQKTLDTQDQEHPIRQEIRKLCGTSQLTVMFSEDTATLQMFRHIPGLIAVLCVIQQDGRPIGRGHGSAILSRINRGMERTAFVCLNAAFMSACNNACKVMDTLRLDALPPASSALGEAYCGEIPASDKQKSFLLTLIRKNVNDPAERRRMEGQIGSVSAKQASEAIKSFLG